jgi:hypothetical protein
MIGTQTPRAIAISFVLLSLPACVSQMQYESGTAYERQQFLLQQAQDSFGTAPVYKVSYDRGQGDGKNELPTGQVITATFQVGGNGPSALLSNNLVSQKILDLAKAIGEISFDVTAICHVCRDMTPITSTTTLSSDGQSKIPAQFQFVPDAAGQNQRAGSVTFSVMREGVEYDFVKCACNRSVTRAICYRTHVSTALRPIRVSQRQHPVRPYRLYFL